MSASISGTSGITFPDASVQNTAATGFGFKNRIINGNMMIDQRNAGASVSVTSANPYTVDRWQAVASQASAKFSVQQSSTAPSGFINSLKITSLSAYSVPSSEQYIVRQSIEGFNTADLGFGTATPKTVTISFWVNSSLTGSFGASICNNDGSRSYAFSYTINAANTWEQKSVTITGDTTGTWQTGNLTGIILSISLGSTLNTTENTWVSGYGVAPSGKVSVVGTNGATFYITGVQLEKGSTATSFDYRPYGTELALCQRYYQALGFSSDSTYPRVIMPSYTSSCYIGGSWTNAVTMRANPTATQVGTWTYQSTNSPLTLTTTTNGFFAYTTSTGTVTIAGFYPGASAGLTLSAEL
jgi:hypothetical protein